MVDLPKEPEMETSFHFLELHHLFREGLILHVKMKSLQSPIRLKLGILRGILY